MNDAVGDVPTSTPSRKMRYPVTPTSSVDAAQVKPAAVSVTDPATTTGLPGTVGLAVSVGGVVIVTDGRRRVGGLLPDRIDGADRVRHGAGARATGRCSRAMATGRQQVAAAQDDVAARPSDGVPRQLHGRAARGAWP